MGTTVEVGTSVYSNKLSEIRHRIDPNYFLMMALQNRKSNATHKAERGDKISLSKIYRKLFGLQWEFKDMLFQKFLCWFIF